MERKDYRWIERLYKRSWEMELLISGFTIILLFEAFDSVHVLKNWLDFHATTGGVVENTFLFALLLVPISIMALITFFSLNLGFRAYWIALIGLMSRFNPKFESYRFSQNRKQNIKQRKLVNNMHKHIDFIDHVGSQLFAVAFLFLCYFAMIVLFMIQVLVISFSVGVLPSIVSTIVSIVATVYIILYLLFFIDVTLGGLFSRRKWAWINKPFYYVYCIFRYASGYFLFERVALSGRKNGLNKLVLLSFIVFSGYFGLYISTTNDADFISDISAETSEDVPYKYEIIYLSEYSKKGLLSRLSIDQRIYQQMPVKLFVPLTIETTNQLKEHCLIDDELLAETDCVSAFFGTAINGVPITPDWAFEEHEIKNTPGISFYIDAPELARGKHLLSVELPFIEEPSKKFFWYYPK